MRHEEKFLCSEKELFLIESRIKNILHRDKNQQEDFYSVTSLYLDTQSDRLLVESINGESIRTKYRIRMYNHNSDYLKLERKHKVQQLCEKSACIVSKNFLKKLYHSNIDFIESNNEVIQEVVILNKTELLRPKVIVEYDRSAYISEIGNVRITFDRDVRASNVIEKFADGRPSFEKILPSNKNIMEVKFDGILPGYIARILGIGNLQRISFSKYVLCRNLISNNGRLDEVYEY